MASPSKKRQIDVTLVNNNDKITLCTPNAEYRLLHIVKLKEILKSKHDKRAVLNKNTNTA